VAVAVAAPAWSDGCSGGRYRQRVASRHATGVWNWLPITPARCAFVVGVVSGAMLAVPSSRVCAALIQAIGGSSAADVIQAWWRCCTAWMGGMLGKLMDIGFGIVGFGFSSLSVCPSSFPISRISYCATFERNWIELWT
jgi:hypothetical protein